jgi:hypothetical protein
MSNLLEYMIFEPNFNIVCLFLDIFRVSDNYEKQKGKGNQYHKQLHDLFYEFLCYEVKTDLDEAIFINKELSFSLLTKYLAARSEMYKTIYTSLEDHKHDEEPVEFKPSKEFYKMFSVEDRVDDRNYLCITMKPSDFDIAKLYIDAKEFNDGIFEEYKVLAMKQEKSESECIEKY